MKKRCLSFILALILAVVCLPTAALAAEGEEDFLYLSLGDSIAAGFGLPDAGFEYLDGLHYEMGNNFQNYSSLCYTALIADEFGWSREQALNLGLPGAGSQTLLEVLQTGSSDHLFPYSHPEIREYVKKADLISLEIGLNDALIPYQMTLFQNINSKLDEFLGVIQSGTLSVLNEETAGMVLDSLKGIRLSWLEFQELCRLIIGEISPATQDGLNATRQNLPQIIDTIRELNPDVEILLLGYANPLPLLPNMRNYFKEMNAFAEELAKEKDVIYIPTPNTRYNLSAHPTASGHAYISEQMIPVIRALGY